VSTATPPPSLRLRTLTRFWLLPKYIYSAFGHALWLPLSLRLLKWAAIVFVASAAILALFGVGWEKFGVTAHVVVPVGLTWWVVKQVGQGAKAQDAIKSHFGLAWLLRSRLKSLGWLAGLALFLLRTGAPLLALYVVVVTATVWTLRRMQAIPELDYDAPTWARRFRLVAVFAHRAANVRRAPAGDVVRVRSTPVVRGCSAISSHTGLELAR
jgi:hypothetical protein